MKANGRAGRKAISPAAQTPAPVNLMAAILAADELRATTTPSQVSEALMRAAQNAVELIECCNLAHARAEAKRAYADEEDTSEAESVVGAFRVNGALEPIIRFITGKQQLRDGRKAYIDSLRKPSTSTADSKALAYFNDQLKEAVERNDPERQKLISVRIHESEKGWEDQVMASLGSNITVSGLMAERLRFRATSKDRGKDRIKKKNA